MSVPKYKLTYFNLRALGEPIRFLFNYVGVPFEDVRIDLENEWPAVKESTGWGKVPILEIDGKIQISQSHAIAKYIARKYNLDGADDLESAKCDEYVGVAQDLRREWERYWFEQDPERKQKVNIDFVQIHAPHYFKEFNKALEENGGKYFVGSSLTWTDFFMAMYWELYKDVVDKDILKPYPLLQEHKNRIYSIPQVKRTIETRLPTKF